MEADDVSQNTNALFEAAMDLPDDERLSLVSRIMDTLPPDDLTCSVDDEDLLAELNRRSSDPQDAVAWSLQ